MRIILVLLVTGLVMFGCSSETIKSSHSDNFKYSPIRKNQSPEHTIKVLFIGNSYTYENNLPSLITGLAATAPKPKSLETKMVAVGGATLKKHWENRTALEVLKQGSWDYVVLQEQSMLPIVNPQEMYKYARLFDAEIKKIGAETVFFLTWARQNLPENQKNLTDAYISIAKELNAIVAPVGISWQTALKQYPDMILHDRDRSHPNLEGSYLAACVFYATFYRESPVGATSYSSIGISESKALLIQRIAWETVESTIVSGEQSQSVQTIKLN